MIFKSLFSHQRQSWYHFNSIENIKTLAYPWLPKVKSYPNMHIFAQIPKFLAYFMLLKLNVKKEREIWALTSFGDFLNFSTPHFLSLSWLPNILARSNVKFLCLEIEKIWRDLREIEGVVCINGRCLRRVNRPSEGGGRKWLIFSLI